jgi:hypothetical protein
MAFVAKCTIVTIIFRAMVNFVDSCFVFLYFYLFLVGLVDTGTHISFYYIVSVYSLNLSLKHSLFFLEVKIILLLGFS